MELRKKLSKKPLTVRQGGVVGTLWLEHGAMMVEVLGEFDVNKFVHVVDDFDREEFALKLDSQNTLSFLPKKDYEVAWALEEKGGILPDKYVDGEFIKKMTVRYPVNVLAGKISNECIDFGEGISGFARLVDNDMNETWWKRIITRWLDIEMIWDGVETFGSGDYVLTAVARLNNGLGLSHWAPVVERNVFVTWGDGEAEFCRRIESGREPIFKYKEKFEHGLSIVVAEQGGGPSMLLRDILEKDIEPLKLWRGFTLSYDSKNGFLEDRMKYLLVAVDSIYAMRPENFERIKSREDEYDRIKILLKECINGASCKLNWKDVKGMLKKKDYYASEGADYSVKMKWLCNEAGISAGTFDDTIGFEDCVRISHKIRNSLSHRGTFRNIIKDELGENLGVYYMWLIRTVQKCIWVWLTKLSNEWVE